MDHLRQGVGLRAYGQRDPLIEYKREAFNMFDELMTTIKQDVALSVFRSTTSVASFETFLTELPRRLVHDEVSILGGGASRGLTGGQGMDGLPEPASGGGAHALDPIKREEPKVGRNDQCPCGSGKKYKKCCGAK